MSGPGKGSVSPHPGPYGYRMKTRAMLAAHLRGEHGCTWDEEPDWDRLTSLHFAVHRTEPRRGNR